MSSRILAMSSNVVAIQRLVRLIDTWRSDAHDWAEHDSDEEIQADIKALEFAVDALRSVGAPAQKAASCEVCLYFDPRVGDNDKALYPWVDGVCRVSHDGHHKRKTQWCGEFAGKDTPSRIQGYGFPTQP